jgi:hypothetical protein
MKATAITKTEFWPGTNCRDAGNAGAAAMHAADLGRGAKSPTGRTGLHQGRETGDDRLPVEPRSDRGFWKHMGRRGLRADKRYPHDSDPQRRARHARGRRPAARRRDPGRHLTIRGRIAEARRPVHPGLPACARRRHHRSGEKGESRPTGAEHLARGQDVAGHTGASRSRAPSATPRPMSVRRPRR